MLLLFCISSICRYIAKTLYGDDDEEVTPQNSDTVEEPKCLGLYPGSNEKNLKPNDITFEKALELLLGKDVKRCG
ncbi:hypothetical protein LOK49_LG12G02884 [Camellia lanceoleosa]|uniref:Uncharacterized protein n=1 Tax=Camellia lanceoleosa TaxID=1840588 RepID=A0ACC0FYL4_9ERIC|nr:hypothetical protein LOK49_LG12G02884 [Camellia lanceoleosa]